MPKPRIPTMPCQSCRDVADPAWWCRDCYNTGRVPLDPLTVDQVRALPDGARVVVEPREPQAGQPYAAVVRDGIILPMPSGSGKAYSVDQIKYLRIEVCRVWLAEDAEKNRHAAKINPVALLTRRRRWSIFPSVSKTGATERERNMTYQITNTTSGADLGTYEGETPLDAYRAMMADAGYRTEAAAQSAGLTLDTITADIVVTAAE